MTPPADRGTDIAALSASVVAVSVAMLIEPGPYDVLGLMIGLSLILVIAGYVVGHRRTALQSAGVAAVLGLAFIPVIGFFYERIAAGVPLSLPTFLLAVPTSCVPPPWSDSCQPDSRMDEAWHLAIWLAAGVSCFLFDRWRQPL